MAIQLARSSGAEITAVDTSDEKLEFARSLGAIRTIKASAPDAGKQLRQNGGPHVALVTAPSKSAYDLAFRTLRRRGYLGVVGIPEENLSFHADDMVVGEFRVVGSAVGTRAEMRELLQLAADGKLKCEVESRRLDEINDIFTRMQQGKIRGRAVLCP
ncbi:MAG: zinc-binding dehydrogenase [Acidobacteria bacterium]|nr:zinc-binding dehydrogenase [Acidobacteriota bacterium]